MLGITMLPRTSSHNERHQNLGTSHPDSIKTWLSAVTAQNAASESPPQLRSPPPQAVPCARPPSPPPPPRPPRPSSADISTLREYARATGLSAPPPDSALPLWSNPRVLGERKDSVLSEPHTPESLAFSHGTSPGTSDQRSARGASKHRRRKFSFLSSPALSSTAPPSYREEVQRPPSYRRKYSGSSFGCVDGFAPEERRARKKSGWEKVVGRLKGGWGGCFGGQWGPTREKREE